MTPHPPGCRSRHARLLAALRFFDTGEAPARPMDGTPAGVGWSTIHKLVDAGLLVSAGDASSVRGRPFRTTATRRAVLMAADPSAALPTAQPREVGVAVDLKTHQPVEPAPGPAPAPADGRKRRKGPLVTQKQVTAAQAGTHVEIRIDDRVGRILPCEAPKPEPRVDKRLREFF